MEEVNFETVTVEDCLDMFRMRSMQVVINDGKVKGFVKEDIENGSK